ncbi:MAG: hypothetical protein JST70_07990 [Bacteroidetes bacterium]|nr:hypothetical protein [Bacteroidota bacterium]
MAFVKENYSESRVNMIYELLKKEAENGTPKDYEIKVDELKVVSRNNDPERLYNFEQFVLPESRNVTIIVHSNLHRSLRYLLLLQEEAPTTEELSGVEKTITAKMQQERTKWEHTQLKKEHDHTKQQLKECEEYVRQLKETISGLEIEKEKSNSQGKLTNTIIGLAGTYLSSNPNALNGIPIIGGMFGGDKKEIAQNKKNEDCLCRSAPAKFTGEISDRDEQRLVMALAPYFSEEYAPKAHKLIMYLFRYNYFIDQAINGIENANTRSSKQEKATTQK